MKVIIANISKTITGVTIILTVYIMILLREVRGRDIRGFGFLAPSFELGFSFGLVLLVQFFVAYSSACFSSLY